MVWYRRAPAHYITTTRLSVVAALFCIDRYAMDRVECVCEISEPLKVFAAKSRQTIHAEGKLLSTSTRSHGIVWRAQSPSLAERSRRKVMRLRFARLVKLSCDLPTRASYTLHTQSPHSPFSLLFRFAETLQRILTNAAIMGLVVTTTDARARMYVYTRRANGRWWREMATSPHVRQHGTDSPIGGSVADVAVTCGCSPTELARVSCSWLGRHSTGAYAATPWTSWTPTPLQRVKPRALPSPSPGSPFLYFL